MRASCTRWQLSVLALASNIVSGGFHGTRHDRLGQNGNQYGPAPYAGGPSMRRVRYSFGSPYERLLGDAMKGDGALFTREDAVEAAWEVVNRVLKNHHRVRRYKRGTWGPEEADALIAGDGGWHNPSPDGAAE